MNKYLIGIMTWFEIEAPELTQEESEDLFPAPVVNTFWNQFQLGTLQKGEISKEISYVEKLNSSYNGGFSNDEPDPDWEYDAWASGPS